MKEETGEEKWSEEQKQFVHDLQEALEDVAAHKTGKKQLKTAQQLLEEL